MDNMDNMLVKSLPQGDQDVLGFAEHLLQSGRFKSQFVALRQVVRYRRADVFIDYDGNEPRFVAWLPVIELVDTNGAVHGESVVLWNGWDCPYFEAEAAMQVCEHLKGRRKSDEDGDKFLFVMNGWEDAPDEIDIFGATEITTPEGVRTVYPIGAYCWTWSEDER